MSSEREQIVHRAEGDYDTELLGAKAIIRRMMEALNLKTQSALAQVLGVQRAAVSDAKRQGRVPAEWVLKLCRVYGLNPAWMESGRGAVYLPGEEARPGKEVREAEPAYGDDHEESRAFMSEPEAWVAVGSGIDGFLPANCAFRRKWLQAKGAVDSMRLLRVTGQSMEPTLQDEDVVLVDLSQADILAGKIYALRMDDQIVVKRLEKKPGRLVLISDNRQLYEPVDILLSEQGDVEVIGRVVWVGRELV